MPVPDDYDTPELFTTGAVGRPGQRVFYLQLRVGGDLVNVRCEKQQVAALGEYLAEQLDDLPAPLDAPPSTSLGLTEPGSAAFILGSVAVAFDTANDRFVLVLEEVLAVDPDTGEPDPHEAEHQRAIRVRVTRGQALAFARRAADVVAAGRPPCVWCGRPLDPEGHACPRMN